MSSRSDISILINGKILTGGSNTRAAGAREVFNALNAESVNREDDANVAGGYLRIDQVTGKVDTSFISKTMPTGQFLRDDGAWASPVATGEFIPRAGTEAGLPIYGPIETDANVGIFSGDQADKFTYFANMGSPGIKVATLAAHDVPNSNSCLVRAIVDGTGTYVTLSSYDNVAGDEVYLTVDGPQQIVSLNCDFMLSTEKNVRWGNFVYIQGTDNGSLSEIYSQATYNDGTVVNSNYIDQYAEATLSYVEINSSFNDGINPSTQARFVIDGKVERIIPYNLMRYNSTPTLSNALDIPYKSYVDTADALKLSISNFYGYPCIIEHSTFNPLDGQTYFWGGFLSNAPTTSEGIRKKLIGATGNAGVLKLSIIQSLPVGSNEDCSLYVKIDGDPLQRYLVTSTLKLNAANQHTTYSGLTIPVTNAQYFEMELVCPTWVLQNPTGVRMTGELIVK